MASAAWRIRDRSTFDLLRRAGVRSRRGPVTVVYAPDQGERARVAFGVGRRVGTAVTRNRLRRVLRDELRHADLAPGAYLVNLTPAASAASSGDLRADLRAALGGLDTAERRTLR